MYSKNWPKKAMITAFTAMRAKDLKIQAGIRKMMTPMIGTATATGIQMTAGTAAVRIGKINRKEVSHIWKAENAGQVSDTCPYIEYLGTDGKWYHESTLKQNYKDGPNPNYNPQAARMTHIPLD